MEPSIQFTGGFFKYFNGHMIKGNIYFKNLVPVKSKYRLTPFIIRHFIIAWLTAFHTIPLA